MRPSARAFCRLATLHLHTLLLCCALSPSICGQAPFPGTQPGSSIGGQLPAGYETSGAAWHPRLDRLLVVSDEGWLSSLDAAGGEVTTWPVAGDLEAVCVADPDSPRIYIGREQPDAILEYDLDHHVVLRTFDLTPFLTTAPNLGLEAMTFVPDPSHPEGGRFYVGVQETGAILVVDLPIATSSTSTAVTLVQSILPTPTIPDLAGLDFDRTSGVLWACHDLANTLRAMQPIGPTALSVLGDYVLPGNCQEGIAIDPCNRLFVTDDSGPLWSYGSFLAPSTSASWTNYGAGHPGTLQVPSLTMATTPIAGAVARIQIGNSLGTPTLAALVLGSARATAPTPFGGMLLVAPAVVLPVALSVTGELLPLPLHTQLCGQMLNLQAVELDLGASHGVAFSAGLELMIGI